MPSSVALQYDILFRSILIGISVLWLMANYLPKFGGAIRFLLSFGTVVIVAGLGTLSYSTEFSNETAMFLALFIFMALTMLVAMTLSRILCGRKYRPVCFMLWLALWILLSSMVAMFGFIIVGSIIMSGGPDFSEPNLILMLIMSGLVFGLCLYILNLPFMILGFTSSFFRERFCACLGLKPIPADPKQVDTSLINEQNPGTEMSDKGDSA